MSKKRKKKNRIDCYLDNLTFAKLEELKKYHGGNRTATIKWAIVRYDNEMTKEEIWQSEEKIQLEKIRKIRQSVHTLEAGSKAKREGS